MPWPGSLPSFLPFFLPYFSPLSSLAVFDILGKVERKFVRERAFTIWKCRSKEGNVCNMLTSKSSVPPSAKGRVSSVEARRKNKTWNSLACTLLSSSSSSSVTLANRHPESGRRPEKRGREGARGSPERSVGGQYLTNVDLGLFYGVCSVDFRVCMNFSRSKHSLHDCSGSPPVSEREGAYPWGSRASLPSPLVFPPFLHPQQRQRQQLHMEIVRRRGGGGGLKLCQGKP